MIEKRCSQSRGLPYPSPSIHHQHEDINPTSPVGRWGAKTNDIDRSPMNIHDDGDNVKKKRTGFQAVSI